MRGSFKIASFMPKSIGLVNIGRRNGEKVKGLALHGKRIGRKT